jgi:hypothetical protein
MVGLVRLAGEILETCANQYYAGQKRALFAAIA